MNWVTVASQRERSIWGGKYNTPDVGERKGESWEEKAK